jgi:diaminohydroxyphosphoribosylaminopyrimidine deaminase/5-amino-6-(5-phosphoribosylamino)uracil reductase
LSELSSADLRWLDSAVRMARPHLGSTGGYPLTAAIIVDETLGLVFGRGLTGPAGRPHAEIAAVADARGNTRGRTIYITLEPSAEPGPLPSEAEVLIEAELARVVIGMQHPDKRKAGRGAEALRGAGMDVVVADHPPSRTLHEAYTWRVKRGRPLTNLVIAISRDGMVARRDGTTAAIMCPVARRWTDMQRATCDAVMIGARTAELDNPHLDIAINGLQDRAYTRILLLGSRPLPPRLNLIHGVSGHPTIVFTEEGSELDLPPGIERIGIEARNGRPDLRKVMAVLAQRGISALQVEGGARLIEAMIAAELADRIYLIQSPDDLGRAGVPATPLGSIDGRLRAAGFTEKHTRLLGEDMLRTFEQAP